MALTVNEMTFEAIQRSMILSILEHVSQTYEKAIQNSAPPSYAGDFMFRVQEDQMSPMTNSIIEHIAQVYEKAIQDSEPPRCAGDFMELMESALF